MSATSQTKTDPNVKIPPAVLAAAKRSEEIFNQVNNVEPPAETPAATPEPPVEPTAPPVAAAPTPTEPPPAPPPAATPEPIDWERRYNSMKGRHDVLVRQVQDMSSEVAQLRAAPPPAPTVPRELQAASLLTPAEVNEYGEEFLGVVGKKAQELIAPLADKLKTIESQIDGVGKVTFAQARSNLEAMMDAKCPSWRDVNFKDEFHAWLALPDTYSGVMRHTLLKAAYERNDSPRVLAFFQGFLSEEAAVAPPVEPQPSPGPAPDKVPLETLAAPGRAKTAAAHTPTAPAEKPILTRAQISSFYAAVAAGRYRGRDADKQAAEEQIFAAEREGRIR
jgi:hypothetical protein